MRNRYLFLIDACGALVIPSVALLLRYDYDRWLTIFEPGILIYTAITLAVKLAVFHRAGLYSRYWRYASVSELNLIVGAVALTSGIALFLLLLARFPTLGLCASQPVLCSMPRSLPFLDGLLTLFTVGGVRYLLRMLRVSQVVHPTVLADARRTLVVGAGDAGSMIVREMTTNPQLGLQPIGFVDDDPAKQGMRIYGLPVLGHLADIPTVVQARHIDDVIIAMPSAPGTVIRQVMATCEQVGVTARTMPGLYEILSGHVTVNQVRPIEIADLLRRAPVEIDAADVVQLVQGRHVMVTGGGGSIGSELCRQLAGFGVASLAILGHGENSLFSIAGELRRLHPRLQVQPVVADIRDVPRLEQVFRSAVPHVIFHAAAHKHVPLMEANPEDAVTNNVMGTRNLLRLAQAHGVAHFVLISSDKAVNPSSVMGCTKRVAELLVQQAAQQSGHAYVAVRFGNVLGSRGSVVPLFRQQIALGGPVTVSHPEVKRYFMSVEEAVRLVLQAAAWGRSGDLFVLDMGEPIKIVDLARDLIRLSGLEPERDIGIVFTGLRPGEKLFEELFLPQDRYRRTRNERIFLSEGSTHAAPPAALDEQVDRLIRLAQEGDTAGIQQQLQAVVPEYAPTPALAAPAASLDVSLPASS